ncbi:MAG: prepilin-type N-terminal cleavage/methylation domain-containing protein [Phycisphaerae bacterium]|jgi:prepilin-type N-terminal cleavage/methylation domain-containing protein|nr:prepilin-type N-terminal cleavage/methylation domain-containing protein [Phycisphaerae bacterium]
MRRGATLLELIITIAVIGIIAAIAAPRFARAQDGASLDAAARRLVAELGAIRQRAMISRTAAVVTLSVDGGKVRVGGIDTTGLSCAGGGFDLGVSPYGAAVVKTNFAGEMFTIDAYGALAAEGTIAIARGDATRTITITRTGAISWQ